MHKQSNAALFFIVLMTTVTLAACTSGSPPAAPTTFTLTFSVNWNYNCTRSPLDTANCLHKGVEHAAVYIFDGEDHPLYQGLSDQNGNVVFTLPLLPHTAYNAPGSPEYNGEYYKFLAKTPQCSDTQGLLMIPNTPAAINLLQTDPSITVAEHASGTTMVKTFYFPYVPYDSIPQNSGPCFPDPFSPFNS